MLTPLDASFVLKSKQKAIKSLYFEDSKLYLVCCLIYVLYWLMIIVCKEYKVIIWNICVCVFTLHRVTHNGGNFRDDFMELYYVSLYSRFSAIANLLLSLNKPFDNYI